MKIFLEISLIFLYFLNNYHCAIVAPGSETGNFDDVKLISRRHRDLTTTTATTTTTAKTTSTDLPITMGVTDVTTVNPKQIVSELSLFGLTVLTPFNLSNIGFDMLSDTFDQLTTNNPCLVHYCNKGHECIVNKNGLPECICQRYCTHRKKYVCGNNNIIYNNHCELHRAACILNKTILLQRYEKCTINNHNNSKNKYKNGEKLFGGSINGEYLEKKLKKKFFYTNNMNVVQPTVINSESVNNLPLININKHDDEHNNEEANSNIDDDDMDLITVTTGTISTIVTTTAATGTTTTTPTAAATTPTAAATTTTVAQSTEQMIDVSNYENRTTDPQSIEIPLLQTTNQPTILIPVITTIQQQQQQQNDTENEIELNNNFLNNLPTTINTDIIDTKILCTSQEYEIMKDNLLLYSHARLMSQDNNHSKDFLISIMFSHYDQNNNGHLERDELMAISKLEHLDELSNGCTLDNILNYDDIDHDNKLSVNEFYQAFSKLYSVSVVSLDKALEINHLSARVGDNVEIKCDVTGTPTPPIIWRRNNIDLTTINEDDVRVFSDGSLYLTKIQLIHGGNYTCHAQRNKDVVQTHILTVHTIPEVSVMPRIQSKRPGESTEMYCHVIGEPMPNVVWLKNDDSLNIEMHTGKYDIIGNGTTLKINNIAYSDTGAYMCQASNIGGTIKDISSLVVQEEPTPTVVTEERKFFVFHEYGVAVYEPSACRLHHQIQGTDIIPGTQEYVCGNKGVSCSWGRAINVNTHYIYISQPLRDRVLVISTIQMVVVDVIQTDKYPVELYYIKYLDQVWILNWRFDNITDTKTIQVIRDAGEKRKHHTVHPEPIDGQFDLVKGLFIPTSLIFDTIYKNNLNIDNLQYKYGYVTHKNQRGLYKIDLANLRYTRSVDLALYNCVPENIVFSSLYGYVIMSCREPITNRPQGQLILDYLTDTVITTKFALIGQPYITPDSRHLVTIDHRKDGVILIVQKIMPSGLQFSFDVKTTLNISDVTFYESQTMHGYDLYASASDKEDILFLNLYTGKVEMITGVGPAMSPSLTKWGNPIRPIRSSGLFGQYMVTPANNALFVINGRARTVNCEIGGVLHPTSIVWWLPTATTSSAFQQQQQQQQQQQNDNLRKNITDTPSALTSEAKDLLTAPTMTPPVSIVMNFPIVNLTTDNYAPTTIKPVEAVATATGIQNN